MNLVFVPGFLIPQHIFGIDYFRDLPARYPGALFADVPVAGSVKDRAGHLADQIAAHFPNGPIHIVAHSMGGLDGRYLLGNNLHHLAEPGRVACLSTISTPHRGCPIADLLTGPAPSLLDLRSVAYHTIKDAFESAAMDVGALGDLTTGLAREFNRKYPPLDHVRYFWYAGKSCYTLLLKASHFYLQHVGQTPAEQTNDGLVSLAAAAWGESPESPWDADHLSEVGHLVLPPLCVEPKFDYLAAYERLIARGAA